MPHLSCRTCGRRVYSVAPLSSMTADERRCPRCGTPMLEDRRGPERRMAIRRENPPHDPGPPPASPSGTEGKKTKGDTPDRPERRIGDRRSGRRRGGGSNLPPAAGNDSAGWQD
jgi:DNA-directed RNA polymerase subunit RPC12/RpoP